MNFILYLGKSTSGKWAILFISIGLGISLSYISLFCQGYSMSNLISIFQSPDPKDGLALGWANSFQQLGMFGLSWWLLNREFTTIQPLERKHYPFIISALVGILWLILSYGLIEFSSAINQFLLSLNENVQNWAHQKELNSWKIQVALLSNNSGWGLIQVVLIVAIIPGVLEELFFRSILLRWKLQSLSPFWAILLNGFIFSFIHFQFEGFLARWMLGAMLGYAYWKTGKIGVSIAMHVLNNLMSILLYIFVYQEMNFSQDHWIHHPLAILVSSLFFIAGWKGINYLWRPKGLSS
jgi:membrane protease YdiL (CAAX protease family)